MEFLNKILKIIEKKTYLQICFLLLIGLVFLVPLFKNNFYLSHDGEAQVARFGAYVKAFEDKQFPPRWAGDLNYRFGSPVLIFYYPLPGFISVPLSLSGIDLETTFKIIIGFSFVFSFTSFFLWIKQLTRDVITGIFGAALYGLAPYHFLNLYVRGDIAELLALSIAPLVFYFLEKVFTTQKIKFVALTAFFYSLLILSHNSVSLVFSIILALYVLFRSKSKKNLFLSFLSLGIGLVASSFFWLPAIVEAKYTNSDLFIGQMFKDNFPSLLSLVYSRWGFGPEVNRVGGLSPQIGTIHWLLVLCSVPYLFKKTKSALSLKFWIITFVLLVFMTISLSSPVWKVIPLLPKFQFPWRFIGVAGFCASVIGALFSQMLTKQVKVILLILIVIYSFGFLVLKQIPKKSDFFYFSYPGTTYYHGQASSIWTAGDFYSFPKNKLEIIGGKGKFTNQNIKSNKHDISLSAKTELTILDNTVYFPGWRAMVDGVRVPVEFQDMNHRGLITFKVPKGIHKVNVIFGESAIRLMSDCLSLVGFFLIILLLSFASKIDKIFKK